MGKVLAGGNPVSRRDEATAALAERPPGYRKWLAEVKARVQAAQQRAALAVNRELLMLYWQLGRDLLERQAQPSWGRGVIAGLVRSARSIPGHERLLALKSQVHAGIC